MSTPGQTYGVSPFTDSLIDGAGIDACAAQPGLHVRHHRQRALPDLCRPGLRPLRRTGCGTRGLAPLGLVLVLLSHATSSLAAVTGALGLTISHDPGLCILLLLFFVLRFSGQGVLTMVSRNMMVKWFDRHRGLVTGLSGMVIAPAFSATPAVLHPMVEHLGWRGAWLWLAVLIGGGLHRRGACSSSGTTRRLAVCSRTVHWPTDTGGARV